MSNFPEFTRMPTNYDELNLYEFFSKFVDTCVIFKSRHF